MNNVRAKWLAQSTIYRNSVDLIGVIDEFSEDKMGVIQPVVFIVATQSRHNLIDKPSMSLSHESAQTLLQALWDAGLRPNNGAGSGAEVSALKGHIKYAEDVTRSLLERK